MTISELIALLSNAPCNTNWYCENRTLTSHNYQVVNKLLGIEYRFGVGFCLILNKDCGEDIYELSDAAYALLDDDFTIIIKDSGEKFYAITAQEVSNYDISNLVNAARGLD